MIPKLTGSHGKPVLIERTFQQLLAAANTLQQHHDRLLVNARVADHVALYREAITENARRCQRVVPTLAPVPEPEAIPSLPVLQPVAVADGDIEFLAPQHDSVIPPETARNLSILASRLQGLLSQETRTGPAWAPVAPVASTQEVDHDEAAVAAEEMPAQTQPGVVAEEMAGQKQLAVAAEEMPGQGESAVARDAGSESSGAESAMDGADKAQAADSPCSSEPNEYIPSRMVGNGMSQSNDSFLGTAMAVAASAVLCLLLVASAHRLSPLPGGLSRPPDLIQQQVPFQKTESSTAVEANRQKPIATPARIYSPDSSDANVAARDSVTGRDTLSLASRLQTEKKPPGKLPATKVIPAQKTGVKPTRLISTSGDVDVAAEDTLLRYDARNAAPGIQGQKK